MQVADLKFKPSPEQPGFLEIHVRLTRESGESNAWHRINKGFLHRIRRQLLVWRSLDEEAKLSYERLLADVREQRGPAADGAVNPAPDKASGAPA
jgi:hypothetical protein